MAKTILTYAHTRSIFDGQRFKDFIYKYFENPRFEGSDCGFDAKISITNWKKIKKIIPNSAKPIRVK